MATPLQKQRKDLAASVSRLSSASENPLQNQAAIFTIRSYRIAIWTLPISAIAGAIGVYFASASVKLTKNAEKNTSQLITFLYRIFLVH